MKTKLRIVHFQDVENTQGWYYIENELGEVYNCGFSAFVKADHPFIGSVYGFVKHAKTLFTELTGIKRISKKYYKEIKSISLNK